MNSISLNSLPLVGGTSIAPASTPTTTWTSTMEAVGLTVVGGGVMASAPVANVSSTSLVDALKALNPSTAVTAPVAKSAEDVKLLKDSIYLSTEDASGLSIEGRMSFLSLKRAQLSNSKLAIAKSIQNLDPESKQFKNGQNQIAIIQEGEIQLMLQAKTIQAFHKQVMDEIKNRGLALNTQALDANPDQQAYTELFKQASKETANSPKSKQLLNLLSQADKKEYAQFKQDNPEYVQIVKEISDKNKVALENGTHEFSDARQAKISKQISALLTSMIGMNEESHAYQNTMSKLNVLQSMSVSIDHEKTNPALSKMYKDQADIFLKASTILNWESDEYQALMNKVNTLQANTKALEYGESNPALSAAWKKEADLFAILETVGTESPEGQKILAELDKLQIERKKIPTTPVTPASTETPSSTPTNEASIDLPVVS
jgi:hypothetical protein